MNPTDPHPIGDSASILRTSREYWLDQRDADAAARGPVPPDSFAYPGSSAALNAEQLETKIAYARRQEIARLAAARNALSELMTQVFTAEDLAQLAQFFEDSADSAGVFFGKATVALLDATNEAWAR